MTAERKPTLQNRVENGPACSGCGLPNYKGLCPHCRGDETEFNEMWPPTSREETAEGYAAEGADFADFGGDPEPGHAHPLFDCGGTGHGPDISEIPWCHDCTPHT